MPPDTPPPLPETLTEPRPPQDRPPAPVKPKPLRPRWHVAAAMAGWLLPGLGHFLLGQPRRAVVLGCTITTLWLAGLLIGGISVVDRDESPAWFLGQMLFAPSWAADAYRNRLVVEHTRQHYDDAQHSDIFAPAFNPPFEPAYGRAAEQGTLFTAVAGLLNLLAIIDVLYRDPRLPRDLPQKQTVRSRQ